MYTQFLNLFLALISLTTATGILVHDTRVDKATAVATFLPVTTISGEVGAKLIQTSINDFHTHIERGSALAFHAFNSTNPSIAPRTTEDKRHFLQRYVAKGHHAFDNYNLPIV